MAAHTASSFSSLLNTHSGHTNTRDIYTHVHFLSAQCDRLKQPLDRGVEHTGGRGIPNRTETEGNYGLSGRGGVDVANSIQPGRAHATGVGHGQKIRNESYTTWLATWHSYIGRWYSRLLRHCCEMSIHTDSVYVNVSRCCSCIWIYRSSCYKDQTNPVQYVPPAHFWCFLFG